MLLMWSIVLCFALICKAALLPKSDIDLSLHLYTEDGQIAQVAYATSAVQKSKPRVSFIDSNMLTSLVVRPLKSPLCMGRMNGMEGFPDLPYVCASAGYVADCQHALNQFNQLVQNHCFTYGEPPNIDYLCYHLSQWVIRGMYPNEEEKLTRPLASALVIAGYDRDAGAMRLVEIENTGYFKEKGVSIVGNLAEKHRHSIERILNEPALGRAPAPSKSEWLRKCEDCLQVLVEALQEDAAADNGGECSEDGGLLGYGVECCVVDCQGTVHQPPQELPSVQATIEWLKTIL